MNHYRVPGDHVRTTRRWNCPACREAQLAELEGLEDRRASPPAAPPARTVRLIHRVSGG